MPDQQKVQSHLSKIAHINLLLAVCALVGVLGVYAWFRWGMDSASITNTNGNTNTAAVVNQNTNTAKVPTAEEAAKLTQDYQDAVNTILKDVDTSNAAAAKDLTDKIAALHVPASLRAMHIQLMVVLQEIQDGKAGDANTRISQLRAEYSWFAE